MKQITTNDLRRMTGREGLILQGCGGDLQKWVDGINNLLTKEGILLEGEKLQDVSVFQHDGSTNLLFGIDGVKLDMGRLAMWRLATHGQFGGTWLSDYVPNRLGGFDKSPENQTPDCPLIGEDGNIFNLMGIAARTLRRSGMADQAKEMQDRIMNGGCGSYSEALGIIMDYVNVTDKESAEPDEDFEQSNAKLRS